MGDCVHVYGVLLVGVLSRGVVWLMCVFNQAHAPSLEGNKRGKIKEKNYEIKNTKKYFIN